jgi:hypothetical protein
VRVRVGRYSRTRTSSPRVREQIVRALNAERVARALRASLFQGQFGDVAAECIVEFSTRLHVQLYIIYS